jgi:hypothetical protein
LPLAEAVVSHMHKHRDCLVVLGRGFSVPKITANFLHVKYSTPAAQKYSPFLIFLINFDEVDFNSLTVDINNLAARHLRKGKEPTTITITQLAQKDLLKRNELFLKGGCFSVTYKQLVVDLLCKKVSPLIITGLIVNQAHACEQKESFIVRLIK